ncbi:ATP-binding protein [Streptomyces sp. NPDC047079]|uniref:ATP-binding protein n=1 Tax=Streptomyces sp. NPDC047079 TaxID=3154607 RepID=UPI0033C7DB6F
MDPNNPGPEEYGHDGAHAAPRQRPPRDPMASDFGQPAPALARTVHVVAGDFLVTVNPVDGSEIEVCPPGQRPERPVKRTAAQRAETARAAKPPVPAGAGRPRPPLLERQEERERLVRLLARGRSVRLTGPSGSGRTALLDIVAEDCADLAPDGVIRLSGHRRTTSDLLHDLFAAVYDAPLFRPDPDELGQYLQEVGAVVVLDDLEFGGSALDELLDATPECAFLLSATPDVPAPSADSQVEEVFLGGLDRAGSLELLERAVGRDLTEEEANWAGDLWFESEGLPLRFMQAGALLRQRDRQRAEEDAVDEFGVFQDVPSAKASSEQTGGPEPRDAAEGHPVPLPSLAEAAAAASLLASRLSTSARETLKFAVALGGEVPHQTHLPALVDDTHADAALAELVDCALVSPVGSRYRLAAGVPAQLEAAGYATGAEEYALKAAQHYSWWAGHPSVTPARVVAEADAVLAALAVLVPLSSGVPASPKQEGSPASSGEDEQESVAVRLALQAAPAFAAGLDWGAWERALRSGAEASRLAGEVGEQAYFHHELGILALCAGQVERARAELEASIGLRGALADKRGTVAGRRALALVGDRAGTTPLVARAAAGEEAPGEPAAAPPGGVPAGFGPFASTGDRATPVTDRASTEPVARLAGDRGMGKGSRRNLVAAGAGAALVAVLGTVVMLGMTSNNDRNAPSQKLRVGPSATQGPNDDGLGADKAGGGEAGGGGGSGGAGAPTPTNPGPDGTYGTSDDPTPRSTGGVPADAPTSGRATAPSKSPSKPTSRPPTKPTRPTTPTSKPPTSSQPPSSPPQTSTPPPSSPPATTPPVSNSASGTASSSAPAATTGSASAPESSGSGTPGGTSPVI